MACPAPARWLETAVLSGALELADFARSPARYRPVNWIPPRWDWVDPLKDIQADVLAVRAGVMTLKEAIARQGYDPAQVLAEIASGLNGPAHLSFCLNPRNDGNHVPADPLVNTFPLPFQFKITIFFWSKR